MIQKFFTVIIIIVMVVLAGCKNDDFSPVGELEQNYASFCILDNRLQNQFVRINKVYLWDGQEKMPPNTKVTLSEQPGKSYLLRDTVIKSGQAESMFYSQTINLSRGIYYSLKIESEGLPTQTANVYVFKKPKVTAFSSRKVTEFGDVFHLLSINITKEIKPIYLVTTYIEYDRVGEGSTKNELFEIPISLIWLVELPDWMEKENNNKKSNFGPDTVGMTFPRLSIDDNTYYKPTSDIITLLYSDQLMFAFKLLGMNHKQYALRVKRGFVIMYQIDGTLFDNYVSERKDKYSVRLDDAYYYTNFVSSNGKPLGFFGCVMADTAEFKFLPKLLEDYYMINGQ